MPGPINRGGAPVTMGPVGFWLDADGAVAATDPSGKTQTTPGQAANPQGDIYYDPEKDLNYNVVNGQNRYQSPASYTGRDQGTGHGMTAPGGGFLHTQGTWNPATGKYDQGINWGNLLSAGIGVGLTGGLASALLSGAAPAAAGTTAGASAGTGAASMGAGGLLPSTAISIPGLTSGGVAGGTGLGAGGTAAILGGGAVPSGSALAGSLGSTSGLASSGSTLSRLMNNRNLTDIGSLLESNANSQASNRALQGGFTQGYDQNMLAAQTNRNATEADAIRKLAQTNYLLSGGSQFKQPSLTLNGKAYDPVDLGTNPRPPSEAQKQGAKALQDQLVQRLAPGGTYTPQPLSSYATPGTGEKASNYGSQIASGLGLLSNIFGWGK